jgi:hypothetical protein
LIVIGWLLLRREPRHGLIPILVSFPLVIVTQCRRFDMPGMTWRSKRGVRGSSNPP